MMRNLSVALAVVAIALGCRGGGLSARLVRRSPAVLLVPYFTIVGDVWSSKGISAYEIDAGTGNLRLVRGSPFAAGLEPAAAAVVPSGTFAYVVNKQSANISGYRLDPRTGALSQVPGSPFALAGFDAEPSGIAVDSLGRHAYAVSDAGISGFSIDGTKGSLRPIPGSPFAAEGGNGGSGTTAMALDPANKFAYVLNDFRDTLSTYALDAAGAMKPIGTPLKVDRNGSLTIDPNGKFQYVTTNCCIDTFSIDGRSGALTPSAHLSLGVPGLDEVGGFAIDPAGKFAYAAIHKYATAGSRIYAYSIDPATGALKTVGDRSAAAAGRDPYALTIDPTGAFAYAFNRGTPAAAITIDAYRIAAGDGRLAPLPRSPFTAAAITTDPVAGWFNAGRCPAFNGGGDGGAHSAPVAKRDSDLVIDGATPGYFYDPKRGSALHYPFGDAGGTITLEVSQKPPAGVSQRDLGRLQTSAGIKLGSRAETVVRTLGAPKVVSACNKRAYFYVTPGGMQLLREFTISHGVVTGISEERGG